MRPGRRLPRANRRSTSLAYAVLCVLCSYALGPLHAAEHGLVAHWDFTEGQGDVLHDRSGRENHGKIHEAVWAKCGKGCALRFDGRGDYVDCGTADSLKLTTDFTVVAWAQLDASPIPNCDTNWYLVDHEVLSKNGFMLRIDGASIKPTFRTCQEGRESAGFSTRVLQNHTFYQVAIVRKAGAATFFVDAEPDITIQTNAPLPATLPFRISSEGQSFQGLIADVRVYDRALLPGEMTTLYKARAAELGKDTSWFDRIQVTPFFYFGEGKVDLEVNLMGILPLAEGDEVVVELGQPNQPAVRSVRMDPIPESGRGDLSFALDKLPPAAHEIRALLRNAGRVKRSETIPFRYPLPPAELPAPAKKAAAALPAPVAPVPFELRVLNGGGCVLTVKGEDYPVESRFSYPQGGENRLQPSNQLAASADGWKVKVMRVANGRFRVEGEGRHYRVVREIASHPNRVAFRDTLTNLTAEPVGILISHRLKTENRKMEKAFLRGYESQSGTVLKTIKTNPTVFLCKAGLGLGLVALDDVFVVHSAGAWDAKAAELSDEMFALDANASYTLEWAVYPNGTGDYYDFINEVRRDEGRNFLTVESGFALPGRRDVPPREFLDLRGARHVVSPCLSQTADDPQVSIEGIEFLYFPKEKELMRQQMLGIRQVAPDAYPMFHVAHSLFVTDKPEQMFPDSRVIQADGTQAVWEDPGFGYISKERQAANWRWWIYYPTLENSFGQALLHSVDVMVDEMGCRGAFMDGFMWGYRGEFTYDRWDGHTAEIDPNTKTIKRKVGSVLLLSQPAMVAFVEKMRSKGAVVIGNNTVLTRTMGKLPVITDKEVTEGADVHLAQAPITMGNPYTIRSERNVYRDVLAKLSWGNLYMYYGEGKLTHPSVPQQQYPITVEEIRSGLVKGRERLVTTLSGAHAWRDDRDLHFVYRYNARGRQTHHDFLTTSDAEGVRTEIRLEKEESAVLKKIPVSLKAGVPVNVMVGQYDAQKIQLVLRAAGKVEIRVRNGDFAMRPGARCRVTANGVQEVAADAQGILSIPLDLAGQLEVTIEPASQ